MNNIQFIVGFSLLDRVINLKRKPVKKVSDQGGKWKCPPCTPPPPRRVSTLLFDLANLPPVGQSWDNPL